MSVPPPALAPVRVWGIVRGREVAFDGALTLGVDELTLAGGAAPGERALDVRYADLDGARVAGATLSLYLAGDDVVEAVAEPARAEDAAAAFAAVARRACAFPELTQHLRGFGSERARPGSDHDRFFGALLDACRASAGRPPSAQLSAFDPEELRANAEAALAAFAAARFPDAPADRRALDAELGELAEPLWAALDALDRARAAARHSPDDALFVRWREWATAVRVVYAAADRAWLSALPALADSRGREGRLWRRVLGRR